MYNDPGIYEFDIDAVHESCWIMAGFEVELPDPGCTLALTVGRSPVVIVRTRENRLRGFFNSCRHRGAQICPTGASRRPRLVCPYHQWSYDLHGNLVHAAQMQDSFDPAEHSLRPIHVETVAGSLYVCLADDPPPFAPFREHLEPLLAPHDLRNAKLAAQGTLVEQANWKPVMENARECYHCPVKHPELAATFPLERRRLSAAEQERLAGEFRDRMARRGLGVGPAEGEWWQAGRFALNDGCTSPDHGLRPRCGPDARAPRGWRRRLASLGAGAAQLLPRRGRPRVHVQRHAHRPPGNGRDLQVAGAQGRGGGFGLPSGAADRAVDHDQRPGPAVGREQPARRQLGGYVPGPYSELAEQLVLRFTDWYCARARDHIEASASAPAKRAARSAASIAQPHHELAEVAAP